VTQIQHEIWRKKRVLEHAERSGNIRKTCRYLGVGRATFYRWRGAPAAIGQPGGQAADTLMAQCEVCGTEYDKSFQIVTSGLRHVFDSFECAIRALAPACAHCGCKIIGHGVEAKGVLYCCVHCAGAEGINKLKDRAWDGSSLAAHNCWSADGDVHANGQSGGVLGGPGCCLGACGARKGQLGQSGGIPGIANGSTHRSAPWSPPLACSIRLRNRPASA
jgi:hypothetical protein